MIYLLCLSILPILVIGIYIYHKDREKEPLFLLFKLFLGGVFSCALTLAMSYILESFFPILFKNGDGLNFIEMFLQAFIGIALVEELSKWLMVYLISYNDKAFDDLYDMIVYAVFVSLGFALLENIYYVLDGGIDVGIIRALLAVPGHAANGIFMGYYLALSKQTLYNRRKDLHNKYILLSIVVPVLLHGTYDYLLFNGYLIFFVIFLIFIAILYKISIDKVNRFAEITRKMQYDVKYCPSCGEVVNSNYCSKCGSKIT